MDVLVVILMICVALLWGWASDLRDERDYYRLRCFLLEGNPSNKPGLQRALQFQRKPAGLVRTSTSDQLSHILECRRLQTEADRLISEWPDPEPLGN